MTQVINKGGCKEGVAGGGVWAPGEGQPLPRGQTQLL